jgi:hypothetical protein
VIYTAKDLIAATARSNDGEFPLAEEPATVRVLSDAIAPALEDLPPHLVCEMVEIALKTVFTMGVAAGIELERGA